MLVEISQRKQKRVFRPPCICEAHRDHRRQGRVRPDGQVDFTGNDAKGQGKPYKAKHGEALHNRKAGPVREKQRFGNREEAVKTLNAKRMAKLRSGFSVTQCLMRSMGFSYSTARLPRRTRAKTMMEKTIMSPTARTRAPELKPFSTIMLSMLEMKIAPSEVRSVEPYPPMMELPPTMTMAMTMIVMSPEEPNSDEK